MTITFYKYQGTGNDFIIIDNRSKSFQKMIPILCNNFAIDDLG